MKVRYHFFNI
jgi:hypothetical protein